MQDYHYIDKNGKRTLTSEMPTALIHELLASGVSIIDGSPETAIDVMERLRIELTIRSIEGRL